jgi:hypothetical protein
MYMPATEPSPEAQLLSTVRFAVGSDYTPVAEVLDMQPTPDGRRLEMPADMFKKILDSLPGEDSDKVVIVYLFDAENRTGKPFVAPAEPLPVVMPTERHSFADNRIVVDSDRHAITVDDTIVHFPRTSYDILDLLARRTGRTTPYDAMIVLITTYVQTFTVSERY